jgi:methionyl-tRNA formyltransferase
MNNESSNPRIIFFGTPDLAVPVFERLFVTGYVPVAVVTAPDKPVGRKKILTPPPIKEAALAHNVSVLQPATLKDPAFLEVFKALQPDVCIVVAYGKLIPQDYLNLPKFGFLNIHPSLLPEYRGPAPIQTAIKDGKKETGISIMLLDKDMDHGPIIAADTMAIDPDAYYPDVARQLFDHGARMLIDILPKWLAGEITPKEQDHTLATITKLLKREDGKIAWDQDADTISRHIRALSHEPGTWTMWEGATLRIIAAHPATVCLPENPKPGTIISLAGAVAVTTASCPLILETIQLEGGKPLPASEFIKGRPHFIGSMVE